MDAKKKEDQLKKQDDFWYAIIEKYENAVEDLQRELRRRKATVDQLEQVLQPQVYYKMFQLGKAGDNLNIDELLKGLPYRRDKLSAIKELVRGGYEVCEEINHVIEESLEEALASSRRGLCTRADRNVCECLWAQSQLKEQLGDILKDLGRQNELYRGLSSLLLNNCDYLLGSQADCEVLNAVRDVVTDGNQLGLQIDQIILNKYEQALQVVPYKVIRDDCGALILKLIKRKYSIAMTVAEVIFAKCSAQEGKVDCAEAMVTLIGEVRQFSDDVDQVVLQKVAALEKKLEGQTKPQRCSCGDLEAFYRISEVVQMERELVDDVFDIVLESYGNALDRIEGPIGARLHCELEVRNLLRQQRNMAEGIDNLIFGWYVRLLDGLHGKCNGQENKCTATIVELVKMNREAEGLVDQLITGIYKNSWHTLKRQPSVQLNVKPEKLPFQCRCGQLQILDLVAEQRKLTRATDCVIVKVCLKLCDCKGDGKLLKSLYMDQREITDDIDELMKECFSKSLQGLVGNPCPGLLKQLAKQERKLAKKIDKFTLKKCKDPKVHELVKCERNLTKEVDRLLFSKCGARLDRKPSALIKSLSGLSVFDMKDSDVDALQTIQDLVRQEREKMEDVERLRQKERIMAELKQQMLDLVEGTDRDDNKVEMNADSLESTNQRLLKLNEFLKQERKEVDKEYNTFITETSQPIFHQINFWRKKSEELSNRIKELGRAIRTARTEELQGLPEKLQDTNERLREEMELNEKLKEQIAQLRHDKDDLEEQVKMGMRESINDKLAMIF